MGCRSKFINIKYVSSVNSSELLILSYTFRTNSQISKMNGRKKKERVTVIAKSVQKMQLWISLVNVLISPQNVTGLNNIQVNWNDLGTQTTMFDSLGKWTTGNGTKMAMRTRQNMKSVQHSPGNSPVSHAKLWVGILTLLLRGHSTTTWTEFCHFLTPPPAWTVFIP